MLGRLSYSDFKVCFGIDVAQADAIMETLRDNGASGRSMRPEVAEPEEPGDIKAQPCGSREVNQTSRSRKETWIVSQHGCVHRAPDGTAPACKKTLKVFKKLQPGTTTHGYSFCTPVCFPDRLPEEAPATPTPKREP